MQPFGELFASDLKGFARPWLMLGTTECSKEELGGGRLIETVQIAPHYISP